jgi:hypothetical protein
VYENVQSGLKKSGETTKIIRDVRSVTAQVTCVQSAVVAICKLGVRFNRVWSWSVYPLAALPDCRTVLEPPLGRSRTARPGDTPTYRGKRRSLRKIAAALAAAGYLNENGRPFAAASVKAMLEG